MSARASVPAVLLAVLLLTLAACSPPSASPTPEPDETEAAPTESPENDETSILALGEGDCFNVVDEDDKTAEEIDCDDGHEYEVYAVIDIGEDERPDDDEIEELASDCFGEVFTDFVGIDYENSRWYTTPFMPTEDDWEDGHEAIVCALYDPEEDETEGSAEGTEAGEAEETDEPEAAGPEFEDPLTAAGNWHEGPVDGPGNAEAAITDEGYRFVGDPNAHVLSAVTHDVGLNDVIVSVVASFGRAEDMGLGTRAVQYGVMCRVTGTGTDVVSGYAAYADGTGSWALTHVVDGQFRAPFISGEEENEIIDQGAGQDDVLELACIDDTITFSVNGNEIGELRTSEDPEPGGNVGLHFGVSGSGEDYRAQVVFRDFSASSPGDESGGNSGESGGFSIDALLARIPPNIVENCEAEITDFDVSALCLMPDGYDVDRVTYTLVRDLTALQTFYDSFIDEMGITTREAGDCPADVPSEQSYTLDGETVGRLACNVVDGTAEILWTDERLLLMAYANREDGDIAALHDWWLGPDAGFIE